MAQGKTRSTSAATEGRIGPTAKVRGRVSGEGNLVVAGELEGNVSLRGELSIERGGNVAADVIEADSIAVAGTLTGEMRVTGRVHVAAGAAARGDVSGGALVLDEGAEFDGRIDNDFTLPPELGGGSAERPRRRS
ncbi:MAG: polymer-forming cytoskeletal protein [Myxococcales bacterium]|jgi:cytoskeletal protein CcmA (bactofilin family)|nr:polymer-forming cytoskeletal protein [Myxococcales bacterium]